MNYVRITVASVAATGMLAAATAGSSPQWQALLIAVIEASADGECPAELMDDPLKAKCEQDQAAALPALFAQMGKVQAAHFLAPSHGGTVEVYRVTFERGETTWHVIADADGKRIAGLWASDPRSYTASAGS